MAMRVTLMRARTVLNWAQNRRLPHEDEATADES